MSHLVAGFPLTVLPPHLTVATMAARTFPRFLQLPFELQVQIWQHAINVADILDELDDPDYKPSVVIVEGHSHYPCHLFTGPISRTIIYSNKTFDLPFNFMGTCRLSRYLMLQRWREVVKEDYGGEWWEWDDYWDMLELMEELMDPVRP